MIKTCGHRVRILVEKPDERTASGIILQHDPLVRGGVDTGEVIEIGPTAYLDERLGGKPWCAVGDRVSFVKYAGNKQKDPETKIEYQLINDEDILCVISKEKDDAGTRV